MPKSPLTLGKELETLLKAESEAADGTPDGLGPTEAALFNFILENGDEIALLLRTWGDE